MTEVNIRDVVSSSCLVSRQLEKRERTVKLERQAIHRINRWSPVRKYVAIVRATENHTDHTKCKANMRRRHGGVKDELRVETGGEF